MMAMPEIIGWVGSAIAVWAAFWAFLQQVLPRKYRNRAIDAVLPYVYYEVNEFEDHVSNELYKFVHLYLSALTSDRARRSHLHIPKNCREMQFTLASDQYISDTFAGVTIRWEHKVRELRTSMWKYDTGDVNESRQFELRLPLRNRATFLGAYISNVSEKAKLLDRANRELRLHSNRKNRTDMDYFARRGSGLWNHIPFRHPASFDTIAMEQELKETILADLEEFADGKEFYRGVGKAWKRGYLLYGPPGTGKTSVVAAMANKLQYDIYDLELTEVKSNAILRELLVHTHRKSIIVIEDIDCSLELSGQRKKPPKKETTEKAPPIPGLPKPEDDSANTVTLSGLLNFTDGLWSACEDERIFVFTTNFINKLDPALLRSGRMDMHIHLSYCTFNSFKSLAATFFKIRYHARYPQLEELFDAGARIVPSEAAEILMRNKKRPDAAMEQLAELLREKIANPPPPEPKAEDWRETEEAEEDGEASPGDKQKAEEDGEASPGDKQKAEEDGEVSPGDEQKAEEDVKTSSTEKNATEETEKEVQEIVQASPSDKKND